MRIYLIDPSLYTLPYDHRLGSALAKLDHDVQLIGRPLRPNEALDPSSMSFRPYFYRNSEMARRLRRLTKAIEHPLDMFKLTHLLLSTSPDVVHFQWLVMPVLEFYYIKQLSRKTKLVYTIHNSTIRHGSGSVFSQMMENRTIRLFHSVIVHTVRSADFAASLAFRSSQIHLIPHPPIGLRSTPVRSIPVQSGRHQCTFLLFGVLKPYKGIATLIEAGIRLAQRRSDFKITIAGKPMMDLSIVMQRARNSALSSHVHFNLGFMSENELAKEIASCDVIVLPYLDIDGSGALAVAVEAGRPIVASRVGGFSEPPFCDYITLVPPGDVTALASALENLLADRSQIHELAKRTSRLRGLLPDWNQFADAVQRVYRAGG